METESSSPRFFASASRGTEDLLAEELTGLGIEAVRPERGGVAFGSRTEDAYRACLWARIASRVFLPLTRFDAPDPPSLYEGARAVEWTQHLGPEHTMAVSVAGARSPIGPSHFIALKTKDAIVDRIRESVGARPNIDKARPDVRIHVHVRGTRVTISLDLAGEGLHLRGRGRRGAVAPLRENLAAALLRVTGWPERCEDAPLFDPMCGSGTLLLEAAAMAREIAPGLVRKRFGGERWRGHDAALWNRLREEARERLEAARGRTLWIAGTDASPAAVRTAREIVSRAGLSDAIRIERGEMTDAVPPWDAPGILVTNPPYGERIGEAGELGPLYERLGDVLRRRFPGWSAWVLSGNRALDKRIGLRAASRRVVFNGPIECRFLEFPVDVTPVVGDAGPGWRKAGDEARGFARRLAGNDRQRARRAESHGLTAYRVYDADVPEFNVAVDRYGEWVRVEEYARPRKVEPEQAERRLRDVMQVVPEVLRVDPERVILRVRHRLGKHEQHHKYGDRGSFFEVREGDLRFRVNLTDYIDTGLFLDDRLLRRWIREGADGLDVLNLFAYTCTASVAAAIGGARSTTSVDLSRTYLDWGRANFDLNGVGGGRHRFVRADALRYLRSPRTRGRFGLVFVAPPVRSRSRGMERDFDVQRDHVALLRDAEPLLAPGGEIVFSTSLRRFEPDERDLLGLTLREITEEITPFDFRGRARLRAWIVRPKKAPG
jgi:23S rRNA (guanine2445-N2)-methyltransferase / 23S rRNA (guanine2069-N7)-methyltransferase